MKLVGYGVFLITSKVLDARRGGAIEGNAALLYTQDRESFDFAQDREPVERPVERQMMP
jgi:hypothetical protein